MSHFMDDHRDHAVLGPCRVGAVFFRSSAIETDHGIFHPDIVGMHRDGHRVRVVKGVFRVGLNGMSHHLGGVFTPKRISFFRVIAHRHNSAFAKLNTLRIPDESPGRGKSKIAHILRAEFPGSGFVFDRILFFRFSFFLTDDNDRLIGFFCLVKTATFR